MVWSHCIRLALSNGELVPPGQARMLDTWADDNGCWADVYDDDH